LAAAGPRYSKDEFGKRGQRIYTDRVLPYITTQDLGKFVAVDIDSGAYELDQDDFLATERLLRRQPDAQIWLVRAGDRTTYRIGGGREPVAG